LAKLSASAASTSASLANWLVSATDTAALATDDLASDALANADRSTAIRSSRN